MKVEEICSKCRKEYKVKIGSTLKDKITIGIIELFMPHEFLIKLMDYLDSASEGKKMCKDCWKEFLSSHPEVMKEARRMIDEALNSKAT